ncbi:Hint domain-containing protein [Vannielia litorea]|uniref:Hint domain-containing protein n=1 Tax=Vannielia litorea TaxID=1217970 RepID=A0A1N6HGB9_9RHOB|nr:Hint domain-containing protein [Vannielia litorea]SIO18908.1 Hint domain-containing protein [Vannielia litorea]
MPTTYTDQFYTFDPANPPSPGTFVNFSVMDLVDNNDDGDVDRFNGDSVNGSDVTASYPGDTVTIYVTGVGNVTYTGITFYLQNGGRVFTPTDGQTLQDGVFVGSSFVNGQGPLEVEDLGPPCFVTGTQIACLGGLRRVESLEPGDWVKTRDRGHQPIRWIGERRVPGVRNFAPVRIGAGTLGNARDLVVSQQHRILVEGWRAEMYFGETEVLVPAKSLLGHDGVHLAPCREVSYWHILLDHHEILEAEGVPTESFDPCGAFAREDCETRAELEALFPEMMGQPAGPVSRPVMRARDAAALFA